MQHCSMHNGNKFILQICLHFACFEPCRRLLDRLLDWLIKSEDSIRTCTQRETTEKHFGDDDNTKTTIQWSLLNIYSKINVSILFLTNGSPFMFSRRLSVVRMQNKNKIKWIFTATDTILRYNVTILAWTNFNFKDFEAI